MFGYDKISLSLSPSPLFLILGFIILAAYVFYVYRFTIPDIPPLKKTLLIVLRILAILILLLVLFEPIVTFTKKIIIEPTNLIFVDNSRSIQIKDGTKREETEKNFLNELKNNNISESSALYSFGSNVKQVEFDTLNQFKFSEGSTNFSEIFSEAGKTGRNISSITIVSDGDITDGSNPLFTAEKLNIPVYTVGIGDSSLKKDVELKNVLYNEMIYAGTPTTVLATINNRGYGGRTVNISFYESSKLEDQKNIQLSTDGTQNVSLNYNPQTAGEKKLSVNVSILEGESTNANNKKIFYVNVLSNKIKVLLISSSPSSDLTFIKDALAQDQNLAVNSITQLSQNKFLENNNRDKLVDSANVIFLIGFPTNDTPNELLQKVKTAIIQNSKPVFFLLSNSIDYQRLGQLQSELPFIAQISGGGYYEIQPEIQVEQENNPIIQVNSANITAAWNNLPPVYQPDGKLTPKPESEILSKVVINNVPVNRPLILTRKLGTKKSIAVLAFNIWRWKLQASENSPDIFDSFILNSVKWLNTKDEQKFVTIKTAKKIYSLGENIDFTGQVYDQSYNPVSDAEVNISIKSGSENFNVTMNSLGNGLYEGTLETNKTGDYSYTGTAKQNGSQLGTDSGNFNIGEVDIEMINPRMNYEFLKSLSTQTGGEFFTPTNFSQLFPILKKITNNSSKEKLETSEVNLWSNEWLMGIAILLFGFEWFLRKRFGML
jgi:hypothetical protein